MTSLSGLKTKISRGEIDTVVVAFPDVFGRLVGKRFTGEFFLKEVARSGTHGCSYLLTVDLEMEPMEGFGLANWEKGFGDFELRPDLGTLRVVPWQTGTALVLCDCGLEGGGLVREAPRSVLRGQVEALGRVLADGHGWRTATGGAGPLVGPREIRSSYLTGCKVASELEFFLFNTSYHDAFAGGYRDLPPSSDYRIDYHTLQPSREEGFFRAVRNQLKAAGVPVECSKGEWGRGQHEVNLEYAEPVEMADRHVVFKQAVKEIAAQQGKAVTFMAKPSMSEPGNSCHIHASLWAAGQNLFWDQRRGRGSKLFRQFLGGLMRYAGELCYFFAPTINAYKRYQAGSWAPTKLAWAHDNRTVGFRVVGQGRSFRIENRMPGADANPYLAFAATLAAGMRGVREQLDCGEVYEGNAYVDAKLPSLPASLGEAAELLEGSEMARESFGGGVVDFYVHTARLECKAFGHAVTDWERQRYFERI